MPNFSPPPVLGRNETRIYSMNSGNEDKIKGTAKDAMGTVKQKTGQALGNERMESEGAAKRVEGKVQNKVGDVKKVFDR